VDTGGNWSRHAGALRHIRICDLSGQLAGAGATRILAAFGAQVIRIEDPVTKGLWDIVRQLGPMINGDTSHEGGSGFNNHNVEKLGITIDLRTERGKELLRDLVRASDAVTENFSSGVMERLGFGYESLKELKPDIVYVSNSGFGHGGPYKPFKSWGPIVQAVGGLTFASGLPDQQPAGWGYSYMDHTGGYMMGVALLAALFHRRRTGEGQWVDMACMEAAASMNGPGLLDATVNRRPLARPGMPNSNRSQYPLMAPHGVYPTVEADRWVAIACRDDADWAQLAPLIGAPAGDRFADLDVLDKITAAWTCQRSRAEVVAALRPLGVPVAPVLLPSERCDTEVMAIDWGLFPTARHTKHGEVRVDGLPVHMSRTDWQIEHSGPLLGEDNVRVFHEVLGLPLDEIEQLHETGVI
jgi:benzylsuccinate CoA-transferase BbsF subunit